MAGASSAKPDWNLILTSCKIPFFETECSWLFPEVDDCEGDDSMVQVRGGPKQLLLGLKAVQHMHIVHIPFERWSIQREGGRGLGEGRGGLGKREGGGEEYLERALRHTDLP